MKKQRIPRKPKVPTARDILKEEIALELGLFHKTQSGGWGALTAAETGRIGGIMGYRMRGARKENEEAKDAE